MNNKRMFYTNVSDYETKEDMMNDFISLRMYDIAKDKEIERLHSIIKEARERVLNENKPLPSAREIIEILDKEKE